MVISSHPTARRLPPSIGPADLELAGGPALLAGVEQTGVPALRWYSMNPSALIVGSSQRLDEIDQKLIELWRERAEISHEVGVTRVAAGGTRLVLARENEILTRFRDALGPDGAQLALLILRAGRGKLV